ncbi:hypothetical protein ACPPVO_16210 [Dactylosporangium sp. McL0621]|uniref:COG1470 family protein n=1 Tax=Dactylosporangium sp. McL0621 TaxID=3415678 RepID=UPI003CF9A162
MNRHLARTAAVLAAVLAVPLAPVPAFADAVTWTVQPATDNGPDERHWIERTLDPGQAVTEHMAVRNLGKASATFALSAADGYLTDKGRFNMLPADQPSKDGGTWIAVRQNVTVGPNETKVVPFTITVPRDAAPGDHPAGIAASVFSSSGTVSVDSRVGFRVMLRASGTVTPKVSADRLTVRYERSWNPLRSGTLHIGYSTTNTGNIRVEPRARAEVTELFGANVRARDAGGGELLPGGARTDGTTVGGVWALGRVRTAVTVTGAGPPVTVAVSSWLVPWPQLLVVLALVALFLAWRLHRRLLERARHEGRLSAEGSP